MFAAVALTLCLVVLGCARPTDQALERRQRASVITRCTVPNTAALTFVGVIFSKYTLHDEQIF